MLIALAGEGFVNACMPNYMHVEHQGRACVRYGMHYTKKAALQRLPEPQRAMTKQQLQAPKIKVTLGGVATRIHFRATEAELRELCEEIVHSLQGGTKIGAIDIGPSAMMKGLFLFQRQGLRFATDLLRTEEAYMVLRTKGLGELQSRLRAVHGTAFPNIDCSLDRFEVLESSPINTSTPSTSTTMHAMAPRVARVRVEPRESIMDKVVELKLQKKSTIDVVVKAQIQNQIKRLNDRLRDRSGRRKRTMAQSQRSVQHRRKSRQLKKC